MEHLQKNGDEMGVDLSQVNSKKIERYSARWEWVKRAEAYDEYMFKQELELTKKERLDNAQSIEQETKNLLENFNKIVDLRNKFLEQVISVHNSDLPVEEKIGSNLESKDKLRELYQYNESKNKDSIVTIDFEGVESIDIDFANEYLKLKHESPFEVKEVNIPENIKDIFENVPTKITTPTINRSLYQTLRNMYDMNERMEQSLAPLRNSIKTFEDMNNTVRYFPNIRNYAMLEAMNNTIKDYNFSSEDYIIEKTK